MARYTGPVCRLCRRETEKLFLKGDRCFSTKCAVERRNYPPGQHGQGRKKVSQYAIQLRQKQKLRRIYGVSEKQFHRYFEKAAHIKGATGEAFLKLLERRLDNVVHRLGFGASRAQARQMICHGHINVNGRKVDIPSFLVKANDLISLKEKNKESSDKNAAAYKNFVGGLGARLEQVMSRGLPAWLELDAAARQGKVLHIPGREEIPTQVNEQLVVEFYSR
ncbi:MAG TPA: 30S ribosomal protein S4 [Candidatus Xenobia bacterium]|jgi:small subunit ribosomal protein S4